jgi:hypothetical protein
MMSGRGRTGSGGNGGVARVGVVGRVVSCRRYSPRGLPAKTAPLESVIKEKEQETRPAVSTSPFPCPLFVSALMHYVVQQQQHL